MYSFYGGRQGASFIIVRTYSTVAEMANYFKQGPNYTTVHYDEHVLINTENKNNPENGRIYRRGYDFTNELGGAIYVGTIVGPAGRAPMLELTTMADVDSKQASEGFDIRKGSGSYSPVDGNIIPGKTADGTFNDEIQWNYCSIRNENDEDYHKFARFVVLKTPRNGFFHKYIGTDVEQGAKERFLQDKLPYIDIDNVYNFDNFKSFAKAHEKIVQPSKTLVLTPEHFQGTQR